MKHSNEFIEYLLELLQGIGEVKARAMFGGFGLYQNGLMFSLIANKVLYFKTDKSNLHDFEERNLKAFSYKRNGKQILMSYSEAPEEVFDDPDEMTLWALKAINAASHISNTSEK